MTGSARVTAHDVRRLAWRRWVRRAALAGLVALTGCTRQHFRDRADKDVAGVLTQKNVFPDWRIENWHVYPDPRARFADPACPDHPPYPPDDPAAYLLSPNPQHPHKKWGTGRTEGTEYLGVIERWDAANRAEDEAAEKLRKERDAAPAADAAVKPAGGVQFPDSLPTPKPEASGGRPTPIDPQSPAAGEKQQGADAPRSPGAPTDAYAAVAGPAAYLKAFASDEKAYRLRLEQAVELALFNSREFQDRREDLYLAALPVTTERFAFAAQALATETLVREWIGADRPGGPANRWTANTGSSVSRLLPGGGNILFNVANQVVVDFARGRPDLSVTNLSLTFVQPLLRGGGYAVTLEPLTQSERTLLYAIRSYARFRKIFYVVIAGQGDYTNNPYGLQGLAVNLGRAIGNNLTAPTAGYLPISLRAATLANERKNISGLEQNLRLYQNLKEGGVVSDLQVVRVELQLLQSQARLLDSNRQYLDQLDVFKLQLGVPTNMPVELDDRPLRPIREQLGRFDDLYQDLADFQTAAGKFDPAETTDRVRERWRGLLTDSSLARGTPFAKNYTSVAAELAALSPDDLAKRIAELADQRQKALDRRAERQAAGRPETPAETAEMDGLDARLDLARFEDALRRYAARPWLRALPNRQPAEQALAYRQIVDAGLLVGLQARNQRSEQIRGEWPSVPPVIVDGVDVLAAPLDEGYTKVAQAALTNRLDLMNARAQVVDAYRQIAVRANALLGQADIRYDLNTASPAGGNDGSAIGGDRTRNALTLNLSPPTVRRVERNNYRAALVGYQRQRRTMMAFEDNILNDVRADLRQLRALAGQYNVQKRAVELAYAQLDNARATLLAPPDPAARESNAAALTEQLLQAQDRLLQAQNALYTAWVTYQTGRMTLYLDLELLPLDPRGVWTDDLSCPPTAPPP